MPRKPKAKLAYFVRDDDNGCEIRFAHSKNQLWKTYEFEEVERTPEYDCFADLNFVPSGLLHQEGWSLRCWECEKTIDSDAWDYDEDIPLNPVFEGRAAFCSHECRDIFDDKQKQSKEIKQKSIDFLETQYPGIKVKYCISQPNRAHISFTFPGSCGKVSWNSSERDIFWVERRDTEAWNAFVQSFAIAK